jgi:hypothetical protein
MRRLKTSGPNGDGEEVSKDMQGRGSDTPQGVNCAGFGSVVSVTQQRISRRGPGDLFV